MQVPRTYISKIENGKAIPTLGSLERLAEALEVDMCQLVRDSRSRREEEIAAIFADPFLAEIAALAAASGAAASDAVYGRRARRGHGPPPHRVDGWLPGRSSALAGHWPAARNGRSSSARCPRLQS